MSDSAAPQKRRGLGNGGADGARNWKQCFYVVLRGANPSKYAGLGRRGPDRTTTNHTGLARKLARHILAVVAFKGTGR